MWILVIIGIAGGSSVAAVDSSLKFRTQGHCQNAREQIADRIQSAGAKPVLTCIFSDRSDG